MPRSTWPPVPTRPLWSEREGVVMPTDGHADADPLPDAWVQTHR
ncbi:hypothetical protein [Deinococcus sp.]|nr:hypothetical protein [Deinococcus sp.]